MNQFEQVTISVNDEDQVIEFTRTPKRSTCKHKKIQISLEDNEVLCTDCDTKLNPVFWISNYLEELNKVTDRNNRMLSEAREIQKKLEKKSSFMCTKCKEVNHIDFKKLPSKAAIERGMSVIAEEFEGMKVEVSRE